MYTGRSTGVFSITQALRDATGMGGVQERETYAIMYVLRKLDYYLSEAVFTVKTDHKPLAFAGG